MNLELWNKVKDVPDNAQKKIQAGRLKGMTDINPMWRIKILTEQFGICGIGWYYTIERQWLENGSDGQKTAHCNIKLYVKQGSDWSQGIEGTGGSSHVTNESKGAYTNDECYKMALTDAISVSCKALGIGAEIYWNSDNTKYNDNKKENIVNKKENVPFPDTDSMATFEQVGEILTFQTSEAINKCLQAYNKKGIKFNDKQQSLIIKRRDDLIKEGK
jgi:hypothetical protein